MPIRISNDPGIFADNATGIGRSVFCDGLHFVELEEEHIESIKIVTLIKSKH